MTPALAIANETFLSLRRDKIFQPLAIIIAFTVGIAIFATDWSIEESSVVYHDIVVFIFQLSGALISIIWGVKIISDSKQDGSIELSMSRPVSRSGWLLGRMLGLFFSLFAMAVVAGVVWRLGAWAYGIDTNVLWFTIALCQTTLLWFTTGAISIFVSSFTGPGTALFAAIALWMLGLLSKPIATGLIASTNPIARKFSESLANLWSLSPLIPESHGTIISIVERRQGFIYTLAVLGTLYFLGATFAHYKDVNS